MNYFEVVLILSPEMATKSLNDELDKFKKMISSNEGKVLNEEDWGLRDLSYSINKFKKAFFNFFQLEISGSKLDAIKKDLNQSENCLRHLFIKVKNHQELPTKLANEKK